MKRLAVLVVIAACGSSAPESPPAVRAFYHWRTALHVSDAEMRALTATHATKLYVKFFDVAWSNEKPEVAGELTADSVAPAGVEIIPTVFLKNEVFAHGARPTLAAETWARISKIATRLAIAPHEIQLDCDWTDQTKDEYFAFLRGLPATVTKSATIRLHQIKFRERTGVPPVDRGMLMFYNMGSFSSDAGDRAIFDEKSAAKYTARIDEYPLPLDVALPIWAWTIHLRDDRVVGLMQSTQPESLENRDFLAPIAPGRFRATRSTFLDGELLREGDELKVESMEPADLLAASKLVAPHLARTKTPRTISLFDLSDKNLRRHDPASLETVFTIVR